MNSSKKFPHRTQHNSRNGHRMEPRNEEAQVTITHGNDRLTLQNDGGYFRALVWSTEEPGGWRCRALITQAEFQSTSDRERWVTDLHSFDPALGSAIIKVGEMEVPADKAGPGGSCRCLYSWREWDLMANRETRL